MLNAPELLNHYGCIMNLLPAGCFDVITVNGCEKKPEVVAELKRWDCTVVEADVLAMLLYGRMERYDGVTPVILPARKAHIAHVDDQSAPRHESPKAFIPHIIQRLDEPIVIRKMTQLLGVVVVALQSPIWRRSNDEMD